MSWNRNYTDRGPRRAKWSIRRRRSSGRMARKWIEPPSRSTASAEQSRGLRGGVAATCQRAHRLATASLAVTPTGSCPLARDGLHIRTRPSGTMKQQPGTPTELFDLSGRVALVTGGSRGLGREMALAFARFGADVIIASRQQDACDAVAEEIRRTTGRRALGRACHVGRWQDLDALADAACQDFGAVDVLVNNAGMSPLYPSVEAVSEELWDKVLAVNLKGPFRLTALIGSRMARGNGGGGTKNHTAAARRAAPRGTTLR